MNRMIGFACICAGLLFAAPAMAAMSPGQACKSLKGFDVPARAIGLPTSGAVVTATSEVNDSGHGKFCKVLGEIRGKEASTPPIMFEVNLPDDWNGKALHMGGGGYDGRLITGLRGRFPEPGMPLPLAQGYVTFGSDSGHETKPGQDMTAFAANPGALANFAGEQLKKTHDVAIAIIRKRYGKTPRLMYFQGNSQGGHEALEVAQRYPDDYNGVIAIHPVYDFAALQVDGTLLGQYIYKTPGAWVSPAKAALVFKSVMATCDGLDGVRDGVISDVRGCDKAFNIHKLRCPGGKDTGPACLSDAQIKTFEVMAADMPLGVTLAGGIDTFPGWPVLEGADFRGFFNPFGLKPAPKVPAGRGDSFLYLMGDAMVRNMIMGNPRYNSLNFNPKAHAAALKRISDEIDASSANLDKFFAHGGKLLLMHGTVDMAVSPYNTINYFKRLQKRYGAAKLRKSARLYIAPGFAHGVGQFIVGWDSLGTLDRWVERGVAPGPQVMTDTAKPTAGRTRPLCEYPEWPKYKGSGDPNSASSFECAK